MARRKAAVEVVEEEEVETLSNEIALQQQVTDLKRSNDRLLRKLEQDRLSKVDLVNTVHEAFSDALSALQLNPVPAPTPDKRKKAEEVAVALVSDLQLAKTTPDYDSEVCEERMELYAKKILELADIQRSDHPVRKLVVPCLGDIIEGEDIFPGQSHLIDGGLYRQIAVDGPRIMANFFRTLLTGFDEIEVVWVIGNHGRIGRRGVFEPETNGDRMLGRFVADLLSNDPRISFTVPDGRGERNWYAVATVGNWSALCIHGDQIRGHSGFPWYGLGKKVQGWASGAIPEQFTDVLMGHWHQIASIPLNKRTVFVNGSTESYNTFAQENLAAMSDPAQWLLFVNPDKGKVTAEYKVWLS